MTTIYTKPQIDDMAVKIGNKIKEAKTTVTQEQGQSTTYAVSQKMITDSLSAFGTAAYKNVGEAAGNVMEVGAFGLGGSAKAILTSTNMADHIAKMSSKTEFIYSITEGATGNKPFEDYSMGFATNLSGDIVILGLGVTGTKCGYIAKTSNGNVTNVTFWTDKNTPTSNLPVASIQAGIGAPKIAYKKLTGNINTTQGVTTITTGIAANKILSVSALVQVEMGDWYVPYAGGARIGYDLIISSSGDIKVNTGVASSSGDIWGRPYKILITYEVD